jgi:hypothetical protein
MATVTERLAFIISANADQAIRAFEKTATSAEKELGKATKNIDQLGVNLTRFGARGLAVTGALAMFGTRFVKAGEEAVAAERKLRAVTRTMGLFGAEADTVSNRLIEMAEATARNTGVDDEIIQATMTKLLTFKQLAKTAGTVGAAFDRATMAAIDLSAAGFGEATTNATQLGKALQDPIKGITALGRAGVTFTDQEKDKIKALVNSGKMLEAQDTLLTAVETQVKGVAAASATTSAKVAVAFDEMKESIGRGLLPTFDSLGGGFSNVANTVEKLNNSTGNAVSKFILFSTVGLGVVSTMSLVAGQAIKMRTRFTDADGAITRMGTAAKTTSIAIGAIAAFEIAGAAVQALGGFARETEKRLNDLLIVAGQTDNTKNLATAFANLADQLKNADTSVGGFFKQFGKAIRIAGADTDAGRIAIEYLDEAFTQIAAKSPALAQQVIDALIAQSAALDKNKATYKDNMMLVKRYQEQLAGSAAAIKAVAEAEEKTADEIAAAAAAAAAAKSKAEAAAKKYQDRIKSLRTSIGADFTAAIGAANEKLAEARDRFNTYSTSVSGAVTSNYSFVSALDAVRTASDAAATAQDKLGSAQERVEAAKREQRDAALDLNDAYIELGNAHAKADINGVASAERNLTKALERRSDAAANVTKAEKELNKATTEASSASTAAGSNTFLDQLSAQANTATQFGEKVSKLLALGISEDSLQLVLAAGAEAGSKIADELIAGGQAAVDKADALTESVKQAGKRAGEAAAGTFYQEGVNTATALVKGVDSVLKQYKLKLQSKGLSDKQLKKLQKNFKVDIGFEFATREFAIPELAEGGIVPATNGGRIIRVAEAGQAEAIIPLSRFGGGAGSTTGGDVHITVNAGVGDPIAIGAALVDVLQKYQSRTGSLPLKVR